MTTTNYLSPQDFKKMVDAIPLVTEYNIGKLHYNQAKRVPDTFILQCALWVQYCHALRVSEVLNVVSENFKFDRNILELFNTKTGKSKKQFTSIPPDLDPMVKIYIKNRKGLLFPFTRQLLWSYVKKACKMAGLELGEQQDSRYVEGGWTHLLRKSRAKMMDDLGCKEGLIARKLRHSWKNTTDRYVRLDINALIEWEQKNIK